MTTKKPRRVTRKASAADILKQRERDDAVLRAELEDTEAEITRLAAHAERIKNALGIATRTTPPGDRGGPVLVQTPVTGGTLEEAGFPVLEDGAVTEEKRPKFAKQRKCADCGAYVPGPNERGDCPRCGAGPFEDAR